MTPAKALKPPVTLDTPSPAIKFKLNVPGIEDSDMQDEIKGVQRVLLQNKKRSKMNLKKQAKEEVLKQKEQVKQQKLAELDRQKRAELDEMNERRRKLALRVKKDNVGVSSMTVHVDEDNTAEKSKPRKASEAAESAMQPLAEYEAALRGIHEEAEMLTYDQPLV